MVSHREREERLQIMLTRDELRAVDDFRYKYRLPSRAATVRELLNRGLRAAGNGAASIASRSQDFGVIESGYDTSLEAFNGGNGDQEASSTRRPNKPR